MLFEDNLVFYNDRLEKRGSSDITQLVLHCTELPTLQDARGAAEELVEHKFIGNCAHFYIDRDGKIYRFVKEERIAHHVAFHNEQSIGIELVNLGRFPYWFSSKHQKPTEKYTKMQVNALIELMTLLKKKYPSLLQIARHSDLDRRMVSADDNPDITVRRRIDPGPHFPWKMIQKVWKEIAGNNENMTANQPIKPTQ